ncbi:5-oxoprolinase subunit PxpA [Saccharophagus degradans]|uniref:LamB/YcsF n=1 Tax=Saccharophagus degradans (strain 2-40 / ATCC 43961 / DSM 17024) TaxID=203122 RepID=Q21NC0_SACD2|nr:5-oxoprolinase subunit PxpA [Saccharophagus degradans]ABD79809.1 LamB/YcsF [Saccharophagus degradans 2-40]
MKLNCDLGEGLDHADAAIMPLIHQANIACGGHTGNAASMAKAIQLALKHHVCIGAHPSYPDPDNFGRTSLAIPLDTLRESIAEQILSLHQACTALGGKVEYVKPHGALYNDLLHNPVLLEMLLELIRSEFSSLSLMMQATPQQHIHAQLAAQAGVTLQFEAFADRRYTPEGYLQARTIEGAVLHNVDDVIEQANQLLTHQRVLSTNGTWLNVNASSLCVHGDNPTALAAVRAISSNLKSLASK